jgi:hypothetical protein
VQFENCCDEIKTIARSAKQIWPLTVRQNSISKAFLLRSFTPWKNNPTAIANPPLRDTIGDLRAQSPNDESVSDAN